MPIPDWSVPFDITAAQFSTDVLPLNQDVTFDAGVGIYRIIQPASKLRTDVRATKEHVPQNDGDVFHRRFLSGCEMDMTVQFWQPGDPSQQFACDELLQEMTDIFMGYMYGLLNAGDNEGRIRWRPSGDSSLTSTYRMLDDLRIWKWPVEVHEPDDAFTLAFTLDCALPYAEDLTQLAPTIPGAVVNAGNVPVYPVWKLYGPFTTVTVALSGSGEQFKYDGGLTGAAPIASGHYIEVNTFNNTVYLDGNTDNDLPGIVMNSSDFFKLPPGSSTIAVTYTGGAGGASVALVNAGWV